MCFELGLLLLLFLVECLFFVLFLLLLVEGEDGLVVLVVFDVDFVCFLDIFELLCFVFLFLFFIIEVNLVFGIIIKNMCKFFNIKYYGIYILLLNVL